MSGPGNTLRDIAHDVQRDNPHLGSKADVEHMAKAFFDIVLERVAKGAKVSIRGFGAFEAKLFKGRTLSSPLMKGGTIEFKDQLVLRFRQSQSAKVKINEINAAIPKKAKAKDNGKADAKPADDKKVKAAKAKKAKAAKAKKAKAAAAAAAEEA